MSFKQNLLKARSGIVFILALIAGTGLIFWLENLEFAQTKGFYRIQPFDGSFAVGLAPERELTHAEREVAIRAWQYFEHNYQPQTGLVNSVDQFPATTLWDTASYLMALISVEQLEIIEADEFETRMGKVLETMATMPLFEGKLPNKSYNTQTAEMTDYQNNKTPMGIGWSAIDIARVMVPMQVLIWRYPVFGSQVRQVVERWQFSAMVQGGILFGALRDSEGSTTYPQEGRLGYEEYAAKALQLAGMNVREALEIRDFLEFVTTFNIPVGTDSRSPEIYKARNYIVSEPYILNGLEFGWDDWDRELASRVFLAQEGRYRAEGILTAVSEDHVDHAPFFVYNTVFSDGKTWACLTETGEEVNHLKTLSTKTAFGWNALLGNEYSEKLVEAVRDLYAENKGYYAGRYEKDGNPNKSLSANTNGIILEALCYARYGPFLKLSRGGSHGS